MCPSCCLTQGQLSKFEGNGRLTFPTVQNHTQEATKMLAAMFKEHAGINESAIEEDALNPGGGGRSPQKYCFALWKIALSA